jgi:membrane protein DedA with SNARE-associated domain
MANHLIEWIAGLQGWLLCVAMFGLAFGESAAGLDLAVPGEVGMVVAAAAGERAGVPLWALIAVAVVGAALGDQLSYQIGRHYGPGLVDRWGWTRKHFKPKVERARKHFDERGGATVFVARWVGALRAVVPFVAGTAQMPLGRFVVWNLIGATTWASTVVTLGYVFGRRIADGVDRFGVALSIVAVVVLAGWWGVRAWRARHAPKSTTSQSKNDERHPAKSHT